MRTTSVLTPQNRSKLAKLFQAHPIALAYHYGSSAKGRSTQFSDIDIAIVVEYSAFEPKKQLRFELLLEDEIAEQCNLSNVDVRVINNAPLTVRGEVVTSGILLFARDEQMRVDYESMTRSLYFDFSHFSEAVRKAFMADIANNGMLHGRSQEN